MKRYKLADYFSVTRDSEIHDPSKNLRARVGFGARELVAKYYQDKYGVNIEITPTLNIQTFLKEADNYVERVKNSRDDDFRYCLTVGGLGAHSTPIIYIRENGKEMLVVLDSLPDKFAGPSFAKQLHEKTGLPVYTLDTPQQVDWISCHSYNIVMAREVTGYDMVTGAYVNPDLVSYIEKNSTESDGCFIINKLPPSLLITSQKSAFVTKYQNPEDDEMLPKGKEIL